MRRSYESPLPLQEGWSSLQTHSRARRDTHRGLALVSGRLGNLHARTALRACSKNLQIAPNCGSWASVWVRKRESSGEPGMCQAAAALHERPERLRLHLCFVSSASPVEPTCAMNWSTVPEPGTKNTSGRLF